MVPLALVREWWSLLTRAASRNPANHLARHSEHLYQRRRIDVGRAEMVMARGTRDTTLRPDSQRVRHRARVVSH